MHVTDERATQYLASLEPKPASLEPQTACAAVQEQEDRMSEIRLFPEERAGKQAQDFILRRINARSQDGTGLPSKKDPFPCPTPGTGCPPIVLCQGKTDGD